MTMKPSKPLNPFHYTFFWLHCFSSWIVGLFAFAAVSVPPLIRNRRFVVSPRSFGIMVYLFRSMLKDAGINVQVIGSEKIDKKKRYIIASNHLSNVDILAVSNIGISFRFIAKKVLFYTPVLGWCMTLLGFIPINRKHREGAMESLLKAKDILARGEDSILIYPEGTRSRTGEMQPFKRGIIKLARYFDNVEILPVVIVGSEMTMRKKSFDIYPGDVKVFVMDPISVSRNQIDTLNKGNEFLQSLHDKMSDFYNEKRSEFLLERDIPLLDEKTSLPKLILK